MFDVALLKNWYSVEREDYVWNTMAKAGFTHLGNGRHRQVYLAPNKRFVLKFPWNFDGLEINLREAKLWASCKSTPCRGVPLAPCRLIQTTVLLMRAMVELFGDTSACERGNRVLNPTQVELDNDLLYSLTWVDKVDCLQVGRMSNGKIVAYDYGSDL